MIKYGLLTNPITPVPKEIKTFKKLGFDYVEIGIEEPAATPQILLKQKNQILKLIKKNKMFAVGHTAYWVHFGSSHEKARKGWVEEAKYMIRVAKELKIKYLNFHFYGGLGETTINKKGIKIFVKNFSKSMKELNQFAKKKKMILMLENVPTSDCRGYGIKEFKQVINSSGVMVHLDIAHAFIEGGMKRIEDYIKTFRRKIVHIHIHDNFGINDDHLPLQRGKINFKKVVKLLKKINYNRTITFEVFTSHKDAVESREYFKKLWNEIN